MKQQTCRFRNNISCSTNNDNDMKEEKKTDNNNNTRCHYRNDILPLINSPNPCAAAAASANNALSKSSSATCASSPYEYSDGAHQHSPRRRRRRNISNKANFLTTTFGDQSNDDLESKQHQTSMKFFALSLLASLAIAWAASSSRQRSYYVQSSHMQAKIAMDSDTLNLNHYHHPQQPASSLGQNEHSSMTSRLHHQHHHHHHHTQEQQQQQDAQNLHLQQHYEHEHHHDPSSAPDAIVVGSGLAGLAAALTILDRGGRVVLMEKESKLGGNSVKASSGINACCYDKQHEQQEQRRQSQQETTTTTTDAIEFVTDTLELFQSDTTKLAGRLARSHLIQTLTNASAEAVDWLRQRVHVDLSLRAQLGGHSAKRTFRPQQGMVGAEIIFGMQRAIEAYQQAAGAGAAAAEAHPRLQVLTNTKVTRLLTNSAGNKIVGVSYTTTTKANGQQAVNATTFFTSSNELYAPNVILATGGFAADRSRGSFLEHYRPDLLKMSTTAGSFSTGDGMRLASVPNIGARLVDMDQVQVHPTGFVDPTNPNDSSKVLAAEVTRGMGGILVNKQTGKRFCNELGTRDYVANQMLAQTDAAYLQNDHHWNPNTTIPTFALILSSAAADACRKHIDFYAGVKHLMTRLQGVDALAKWMGDGHDHVSHTVTLRETLQQYRNDARRGMDEFGKNAFRNLPGENLNEEVFYAGTVTPVVHYCMGGLAINTNGQVLKDHDTTTTTTTTTTTNIEEQGQIIEGLYAAGETTGGVHGVNRLGGNSLLECTVFGRIVGNKIPILNPAAAITSNTATTTTTTTITRGGHQDMAVGDTKNTTTTKRNPPRMVARAELAQHNTPQDCWVVLYGEVYDLTQFAPNHRAGPKFIHRLAGTDGTEAFEAFHDRHILQDFVVQQYKIGTILEEEDDAKRRDEFRLVSMAELQQHGTADDCWVAIHGFVYDITHFAKFDHLGGPASIQSLAGTDGTQAFDTVHSQRMLEGYFTQYRVGKL